MMGAVLLITGSCIGAGMLALPITTGISGFFPALCTFLLAWAFMLINAFLMLEISSSFSTQVNIISMAGRELGQMGRSLSWTLYLFLFYALSVAYISGSGSLSASMAQGFLVFSIPDWMGSLFFAILFGIVVFFGTRQVDLWNRALMLGKILAFLGLVFLSLKHIDLTLLTRTAPESAIFSLPILIIAFGFHNMIPSITHYLHGDIKEVKRAIIWGSLLALGIYLIWEVIVLGIVPLSGPSGISESLKEGKEASQALAGILGSSWIAGFAQVFAFFAILTSFLAQTLALVHFLSDGLKIKGSASKEPLSLCLAALIPPLIVSLMYPQIFFKALNFAGGICANVLFGLLPAVIVWIGRKRKIQSSYYVKGGTPLLLGIVAFSLIILSMQLRRMMGF